MRTFASFIKESRDEKPQGKWDDKNRRNQQKKELEDGFTGKIQWTKSRSLSGYGIGWIGTLKGKDGKDHAVAQIGILKSPKGGDESQQFYGEVENWTFAVTPDMHLASYFKNETGRKFYSSVDDAKADLERIVKG